MRPWTLALAGALACLPGTLPAQSVTLLDTAYFALPRLREASGVTTSSRPGVFWTHNDSGDEPVLYATDTLGRDLGRVRVRGALAVDWESIDAGPCVVRPGRCLYIGDTGDNRSRRVRIVIYRIPEPEPPAAANDTLRVVDVLDTLILRYPDGPRDAEALMVTSGGHLLIVCKSRSAPARAYRVDLRVRASRMTDMGPVPVTVSLPRGRLITGGAVSPDGRWLVLRTYVSLHFFRLGSDARMQPVSGPEGIPIPVVEAQGEGITFDGPAHLVLVSEEGQTGRGMISRLRLVLPQP